MPESTRNILLPLLVAITTILFGYLSYNYYSNKQLPLELIAVMRPQPKQLEAFSLIDQNKQSFTLEQLKSKNTLVFFGYTSCPDICPTTLVSLNQVYQQLREKMAEFNFNVVFVSVDPQRDTAAKLTDYIKYFNQNFIAVTGTRNDIDQFSKQLGAGYVIEEDSGKGDYQVSHTSSIFLIDPELNLTASFSPPHHTDIIVNQLMMINDTL